MCVCVRYLCIPTVWSRFLGKRISRSDWAVLFDAITGSQVWQLWDFSWKYRDLWLLPYSYWLKRPDVDCWTCERWRGEQAVSIRCRSVSGGCWQHVMCECGGSVKRLSIASRMSLRTACVSVQLRMGSGTGQQTVLCEAHREHSTLKEADL